MILIFRRRLRALCCAFLTLWSLSAAQKEPLPAVDDKWKHYQSANFELYSHDSEQPSRQLLHDLETLRAIFIERFKLPERARVEVTVFLFRTVDEFNAYGSDKWSAGHQFRGVYLEGKDRATISVAPSDDADRARRLIFHEYVHHLFRAVQQDPPVWFNEGMAELLAGIQPSGDMVEIGHPQVGRLVTLTREKLLPLEELFAVEYDSPVYRSNDHTGVFYAQSWALLHYLQFGQSDIPKAAVAKFIDVVGDRATLAQVDLRSFFRACFKMDYPEMQRRLERYVESGSYRYGREKAPKIAPPKSYAMRALPRDEIRLRLAELALRMNGSAVGKFLLLDAAAKPKPAPRIFEVLGVHALAEGDEAQAKERWEQALAGGSSNSAIFRELGVLESNPWLRDFEYDYRLPREPAERLRALLHRSIAAEPEQTAAYELLAWVEACAEAPVVPNIALVQTRFGKLKNRARTLVALALVRVRAGLLVEGKDTLASLPKLEWDEWAAKVGEIVLAKIEGRLPQPIKPPASARNIAVELSTKLADDDSLLKVPSIDLTDLIGQPPKKK